MRLVPSLEDLEDLTADVALEAASRIERDFFLWAMQRATYGSVAKSSRILIKVIVCIARFSLRSLARLSRCLLVRPEGWDRCDIGESRLGATS
ncbi:hypothetical protein ACWEOV_44480 [Streptomyces sp. NPDC004365]